jgi:hypothetical protein
LLGGKKKESRKKEGKEKGKRNKRRARGRGITIEVKDRRDTKGTKKNGGLGKLPWEEECALNWREGNGKQLRQREAV